MITREEWEKVNEHERKWWGDCQNTTDEETKQVDYVKYLGLSQYSISGFLGVNLDLKGKSVIDIGGGPVSILLKARNRGKAVVVDPCKFPQWVKDRYEAAGIELWDMMAEDLFEQDSVIAQFDEVWIYNVLQHVQDPDKVVSNARKIGKVVRIFEWIDTISNEGHPHVHTKEWFDARLNSYGQTVQLTWAGRSTPMAYYAVVSSEEAEVKMRFHLLGLAHVPTRKEISTCAYTQKIYKLAIMLKSLGHTVNFYGVEHSEVPDVDEYVMCLTDKQRRDCYGDYDWWAEFFKHDGRDAAYTAFNTKATEEINKRYQPRDFLLLPMGHYNKPVADGTKCMAVESGIGYSGVFTSYRVFESYAWMHYVYGLTKQGDGSWYDAVIPNYFDPEDFPFCGEKEDYFLYMGRLIKRKGVDIASQVAKHFGKKLLLAGQGTLKNATEGIDLSREKHIDFVGAIGPDRRKEAFGKAILTFVPTYYIEPFGGVAVESQLCGTPVLTTDWGVFGETVLQGVTGYRCRSFHDFVRGAEHIMADPGFPERCRQWAVQNYSMDRVRWMYDEYFRKLYDLHEQGWYKIRKDRTNDEKSGLNWLRKFYPKEAKNDTN